MIAIVITALICVTAGVIFWLNVWERIHIEEFNLNAKQLEEANRGAELEVRKLELMRKTDYQQAHKLSYELHELQRRVRALEKAP